MLREERGQCTSCASADLSQSAVHLHCVVDGALLNPMVANSHAWSCEEADLASLGWICVAEQRCTDAALMLDASTRVAAAAGSGLIDLHLHCVVDLADGRIDRAHARCCEEADLASLGWICVAEQLYTDAALVLDASTRVAAAAGSGLIDLHLHCVVDLADGRASTVLMFGVARKLTLRASGGSNTPRSDAQMQRSC